VHVNFMMKKWCKAAMLSFMKKWCIDAAFDAQRKIINSYTFITLIKLTHEKLYTIYIKWAKLSEIENHSQFIQLLHTVETVSFETMYQICSRWLHVKEWVF